MNDARAKLARQLSLQQARFKDRLLVRATGQPKDQLVVAACSGRLRNEVHPDREIWFLDDKPVVEFYPLKFVEVQGKSVARQDYKLLAKQA